MNQESIVKMSNRFPELESLCSTLIQSKEEYDTSFYNLLNAVFEKLKSCIDSGSTNYEKQSLFEQKVILTPITENSDEVEGSDNSRE
jgi:hypothetical protein